MEQQEKIKIHLDDFVIGKADEKGVKQHNLYLVVKNSKGKLTVLDGTMEFIAPTELFSDPTEKLAQELLKMWNGRPAPTVEETEVNNG